MIKNEREYKITKAQAASFEHSLAAAQRLTTKPADVLLHDAEVAALRSQLEELNEDVAEYEALRDGRQTVFVAHSLAELPRLLIKARIALGLTHRELADRLGLKEQQIQRYEATDYSSASLARLQQVVEALGIQLRKQIKLPKAEPSLKALVSRLSPVGIERDFLMKRLLPSQANEQLGITGKRHQSGGRILDVMEPLNRIYGWTAEDVLGGQELSLDANVMVGARFKLPKGAALRRLRAYTVYAHYLAIVAASVVESPIQPIPTDAAAVRKALVSGTSTPTLADALDFVWGLGVPVIPLRDAGTFHGAFWRIAGRNVIVLKQRTASNARWQHDLFHELWHASQEPSLPERSVLEASEPTRDAEEQWATLFASEILLDGRAVKIEEACTEAAQVVERLKAIVPSIAQREGVDVGALANWLAFRLSMKGINWWGPATNLQVVGDPWAVARDAFLRHAKLERLNDLDRELIVRALSDSGEET